MEPLAGDLALDSFPARSAASLERARGAEPCDEAGNGRVGEAAKARVGRTLLGKWRLDALLGVGGFAAVYAATHRNGMRGAVKLLHAREGGDEEIRTRFLREGYIANKVKHDGAVRILDDDVDEDGNAFLVMELLRGEDLQGRATARGGRLPAREVLEAAYDLLGILAAAHAEGIVHRDIKPENLFRTSDGRIKVLDFGIAHLADPSAGVRSTGSGIALGTPAFMSPEQARGRRDLVGPASDVWSVGATMFNLLSGELVHTETTLPELLAATFTKRARSLRNVLPSAPAPLVEVVDRALAFHAHDRWPSATAMREVVAAAFRQITGEAMVVSCARSVTQISGGSAIPAAPRVRPDALTTACAPKPGGARRWLLAGVVVAASLVGGLSAIASHASPERTPIPAQTALAHVTRTEVAAGKEPPVTLPERETRTEAPACVPVTPPASCALPAPPISPRVTVRTRPSSRAVARDLFDRRF